jgi:hypothetical protein
MSLRLTLCLLLSVITLSWSRLSSSRSWSNEYVPSSESRTSQSRSGHSRTAVSRSGASERSDENSLTADLALTFMRTVLDRINEQGGVSVGDKVIGVEKLKRRR